MTECWLISDNHVLHANILTFLDYEGKVMRSFADVNHMNDYMVDRWNSVVKPGDKVYHLGDVVMGDSAERMQIIGRLNGTKTLILGNHDTPNMNRYRGYFQRVYSSRMLDKLLLSHIPVHPMSLGKARANVFGHVHNNITPGQYGPQYYNISAEVINYTPINLTELNQRIDKQLEAK